MERGEGHAAAAPQPGADGAQASRVRFAAFDTAVEIAAYGAADAMAATLDRTQEMCRAFEGLLSRTIPSSDIARLNAAAGEPVAIDPRTAQVLMAAQRYCAASEGAFDVTVGPLVACWGFKEGRVARAEELARAAAHVDWRKLRVWAQCGGQWLARLGDPQAAVDLGGIAKGWIADALGEALIAAGAEGALVNLGGNVLARGTKPDGNPWRVGIRDPRSSARWLEAVEVAEGSLVTSGVYERCFVRDGARYHHVLDPRTGLPVATPWAAVSVMARRSIDAEGFSTTLLALGLQRSRELARAHPEVLQAYFIGWDGAIERLRPEG